MKKIKFEMTYLSNVTCLMLTSQYYKHLEEKLSHMVISWWDLCSLELTSTWNDTHLRKLEEEKQNGRELVLHGSNDTPVEKVGHQFRDRMLRIWSWRFETTGSWESLSWSKSRLFRGTSKSYNAMLGKLWGLIGRKLPWNWVLELPPVFISAW